MSRRAFLKQLAFAPGTASGAPQHTLICVFLRGGADTLNMIVPYADDAYYEVRPTLAIARPGRQGGKAALKLDDHYAFHPLMKPLLPAFHDGHMAIVQGVGSDNTSGSHFEAQDQLEHGESYGKRLGGGWLGRHLYSRGGGKTPLSAVAIGKSLPEALRGAPSASALSSIEDVKLTLPGGSTKSVSGALLELYSGAPDGLGQAGRVTVDLLARIEKLKKVHYESEKGVNYPHSPFGSALREVGKLVKADVGLEVACVDHEGWDTHFFQGSQDGLLANNVEDLSNGLAALYKDLARQMDRVTVIVLTEFGRRIYENSSMGTDHGRGFALMALGGRVKGGRVIGALPILEEDPSGFLGPSGLAVQLDYRSVLAEVVRDLLGNSDIATVFPNFRPQPVGLFHTSQ